MHERTAASLSSAGSLGLREISAPHHGSGIEFNPHYGPAPVFLWLLSNFPNMEELTWRLTYLGRYKVFRGRFLARYQLNMFLSQIPFFLT